MPKQVGKVTGFAKKRISRTIAEKCVEKAYQCEKEAGELLLMSDEHKNKALRYMETAEISHLDVETTKTTIRLQRYSRSTIKYDIELLKKRLNKKILREVISRNYQVIDMDMLKEIMREHGVHPEVLKACILVNESVDNKRMDELYDAGHIELKQLAGCYTLSESTSLKIKEIDNK